MEQKYAVPPSFCIEILELLLSRTSCSREKVKLTEEVNRARKTIGRCKGVIQEAVRLCEDTPGLTPIPTQHFDEQARLIDSNCCIWLWYAWCRGWNAWRYGSGVGGLMLCKGGLVVCVVLWS